jgi:hypothetical protein
VSGEWKIIQIGDFAPYLKIIFKGKWLKIKPLYIDVYGNKCSNH